MNNMNAPISTHEFLPVPALVGADAGRLRVAVDSVPFDLERLAPETRRRDQEVLLEDSDGAAAKMMRATTPASDGPGCGAHDLTPPKLVRRAKRILVIPPSEMNKFRPLPLLGPHSTVSQEEAASSVSLSKRSRCIHEDLKSGKLPRC